MEGLAVGSIPRVLLARILLQLYVIPQHYLDNPGDSLIRILVAGLQQYGETSDLDGLLQFCLHQAQSLNNTPAASTSESGSSSGPTLAQLDSWWWKDLSVRSLEDWDRLDLAYPVDKSEPVNLHIQILTEEVWWDIVYAFVLVKYYCLGKTRCSPDQVCKGCFSIAGQATILLS